MAALTNLSRRRFLAGTGVAAGALLLPGGSALADTTAQRGLGRITEPFTLGVASGDPLPHAVVIWTRLAPSPLDEGGGMPDRVVPVRWEVAADEQFTQVVRRGVAFARPEYAHTVHVDVRRLEPHRWYWYRFRTAGDISPVGRTRTAPARGADVPVTFGFTSCAQYEHGYFTAYRHLADESPDVIFNLGDYIYEYEANDYVAPSGNVRDHIGPEISNLAQYRQRHAQYKLDTDLQAAHAVAPWIVTWDDHETDNNYADDIPEDSDAAEGNATTDTFLARREAAYKAYWEHMPLRMEQRPQGADLPLYRRFAYGSTATFSVLDTRQYRTDQPCGDTTPANCGEEFDPNATILGEEQAAWLEEGLSSSGATWNVVPQQIFLSNLDLEPAEPVGDDQNNGGYSDGWDGYRASRDRLLSFVAERGVENFVVLTGDIHSNWLGDLRVNFEDPASPVLGTELVCTSITANGDGAQQSSFYPAIAPINPHLRYNNERRGYVMCRLDSAGYRTDYRVVDYVTTPGAPIRTDASFVIEAGNPQAQPA